MLKITDIEIMHTAVRDGDYDLLKELFKHHAKDELVKLVGSTIHGMTPLVVACRSGHRDVAEYLIEKCGANVNQTGLVMFDDEVIERAPPLWCAAAAGHLDLVKLLIRHGAEVNATTETLSTPLRAACFAGHFDIVRFLLAHGADIEMTNSHGHTTLMIACYKGHLKIVKFLLSLKANVNRKSFKGSTALRDSIESGCLDVVKTLIKHGARMDADSYGMSPLLTAAVTGHKHIVDYFISVPNLVSRKERIDALELLGAAYVDKKKDMMGALECWTQAMNERYRGDPVIPKPPPLPPVAAYDFAQEVTDIDGLNGLLNDPDEMRMQALVIRERILGSVHPDTTFNIRHRGAVYADAGMFDRCIELWNYALDMQQSMLDPLDPITLSSFHSFIQLFSFLLDSQMNTSKETLPVYRTEIFKVFKKAVLEVKLGKQFVDKLSHFLSLNKILVIALHLASLLTHNMPGEDTKEYISLHRALYELISINAKGNNGRDVLQLAFTERGTVLLAGSKFATFRFPSPNLIRALIRAGADLTARDETGSTVLHLAASYCSSPDLITILLDAGVHIDVVNDMGFTLKSLIVNKHPYESIYPVRYITLACLAARVVKKVYDIKAVPKYLQDFVQLH